MEKKPESQQIEEREGFVRLTPVLTLHQATSHSENQNEVPHPRVIAVPNHYNRPDECDTTCPGPVGDCAGNFKQVQPAKNNVIGLSGDQACKLQCVGLLNGEKVYRLLQDSPSTLTDPHHILPKTKDQVNPMQQEEQNQDYVRKPLNAFMIYMKEQRPHVDPDIKCKGNCIVNIHLAQKWKSLTKEEQAKYFIEAARLKLLHQQQFPGWSSCINYGKKLYQKGRRFSKPKAMEGLALQTNMFPKLTAVAPRAQTVVMESPMPSPSVMQLTFPQNAGNTPAHDVSCLTVPAPAPQGQRNQLMPESAAVTAMVQPVVIQLTFPHIPGNGNVPVCSVSCHSGNVPDSITFQGQGMSGQPPAEASPGQPVAVHWEHAPSAVIQLTYPQDSKNVPIRTHMLSGRSPGWQLQPRF